MPPAVRFRRCHEGIHDQRSLTALLTVRTVAIECTEPLLLFGFNDVYLREVESAFPDTGITDRGNKVILRGDKASVDLIDRILNELIVVLNRNGNLTEKDVDTVLALFTTGDGASAARDTRDVVLFKIGRAHV